MDNHYLERFGGAVILSLTESGLGIVRAAVSKGGNTYISTDSANNLAEQIPAIAGQHRPDLFEAQGRNDRDLAHHTEHIRRHWPATRITLRGDGHYGRPEVMAWCEDNAIDYVFGLPGNATLDRAVEECAFR